MLDFPRWKIALIGLVLLVGVLYAAPNLIGQRTLDRVPDWLPNETINLGLDLQGGSHLLLEVDMSAVMEERMATAVDTIRSTLREAGIGYTALGSTAERAQVTIREADRVEEAADLIRDADDALEVAVENRRLRVTLSESAYEDRRLSTLQQSIEIVRRRIDETGTREPVIQRQGDQRIIVQLPGVEDPGRIKSILGQTARLTFRLVDTENSVRAALQGNVPPGAELLYGEGEGEDGQGQPYLVKRRIMVSGENLIDAQPSFQDGQPVVSFRFDSVGGKRFADATSENVGRPFAIILDDTVISAPVIREPILGGSGVISGSFTTQEAQDLALLLRAGALPAPLDILEERTVGPGLGADSIAAGKAASVLGLVLVVVFMAFVYGRFGVMADVALLTNLILIVAVLSGLQATLTLPGIAGIVLTIGMAVDANVLIFERIREEQRNGRPPVSAIDAGYRRAISTIVDANITTLIAAVLLYIFGSGPIRGFAVTLGIGLATSMFTAIMVTRLMVVAWLRRNRPKTLPI